MCGSSSKVIQEFPADKRKRAKAEPGRHFERIVAGRDITLTAKKANKEEKLVQVLDTGVTVSTEMHQIDYRCDYCSSASKLKMMQN
jgi:hypothetical protein